MNEILQKLKTTAEQIDIALANLLDETDPDYAVLFDAMRYSALGGGKRIRPFLTLSFCRMYGGEAENALPFACALEMIHTYSLIHDDLPCMDNDDYRRGALTNHKKFGEATALLAGDALLTGAFSVAASNGRVSEAVRLKAVQILSENAGAHGMIGGQQMDLSGESRPLSYEQLLKMNGKKTGCLFRAACMLGCLAAGQGDFSAALRYADAAGLAFQLTDDLLDRGQEDEKTTFLSFLSVQEASALADKLTADACGALEGISGNASLIELARFIRCRES